MIAPVVFATEGCPHCRAVLEFLAQRGIAAEVRDVAADQNALVHLIWLTGRATVPTVVVGRDILIGFDAARLQDMLEAAKGTSPAADENGPVAGRRPGP